MIQTFDAVGETLYRHTLPNGLTVLVSPRPGFTRKLAYFVTDYGSIHRKFTLDGKSVTAPAGVAHYLEHKMFDLPDRDVSAEFAALGAHVNAFTSYDVTAYYFGCTVNFESCLKLLLEFVSTPWFTEESVAKEQGIIGQEIGMNADNPDTRIFENLMQTMYENHPIREPILGTQESIAQIDKQVLYESHRAFYRPGNMLLCVVGDVDPEEVTRIAEQILPPEEAAPVQRQDRWDEKMEVSTPYVECDMEVAMPMFQLGFKCEPLAKGEEAVRLEFVGDLAAEALFGESSALYLKLYEEGIIDSSFGGGFETVDGMAMLTCAGDSEDPEAVREALLEQAKHLAAQGIPETDFARMKRSAMGRRIRELDSFDSTCFRLCAYHLSGYDYFNFPGIYETITAEDVCAFLERIVTRERCCLSVINPLTQED